MTGQYGRGMLKEGHVPLIGRETVNFPAVSGDKNVIESRHTDGLARLSDTRNKDRLTTCYSIIKIKYGNGTLRLA